VSSVSRRSAHLTTRNLRVSTAYVRAGRSNRSILFGVRIRKSFRSPFLFRSTSRAGGRGNIDTLPHRYGVPLGAPGPATVPATIARIVAVNKLINLFILTPAASATLCGGYGWQGRQQKTKLTTRGLSCDYVSSTS